MRPFLSLCGLFLALTLFSQNQFKPFAKLPAGKEWTYRLVRTEEMKPLPGYDPTSVGNVELDLTPVNDTSYLHLRSRGDAKDGSTILEVWDDAGNLSFLPLAGILQRENAGKVTDLRIQYRLDKQGRIRELANGNALSKAMGQTVDSLMASLQEASGEQDPGQFVQLRMVASPEMIFTTTVEAVYPLFALNGLQFSEVAANTLKDDIRLGEQAPLLHRSIQVNSVTRKEGGIQVEALLGQDMQDLTQLMIFLLHREDPNKYPLNMGDAEKTGSQLVYKDLRVNFQKPDELPVSTQVRYATRTVEMEFVTTEVMTRIK